MSALASELPTRNGWSIAEHAGDRSPDRVQRLLNRASWDELAAMSEVRRFAAAGLEEAARRGRRKAGMTVGALDETGQEKAGEATAGVKRQYMGCAGRVANGINTVHLSFVREKTGHALIGARQWIPREHIEDPVKSLAMGLPPGLAFRTKGQLAIDVLADADADSLAFDFICGDEVYGSCTDLRGFLEERGQAYVLRVASNFTLTLAPGTKATCAEAVKRLVKDKRRWEVRSAGKGSKGERWYAWAWIGTASPRHHLLVRRHLRTGELAFHYCYVPEGQLLTKTRLIRAAGLRWPVVDPGASNDCDDGPSRRPDCPIAPPGRLSSSRLRSWNAARQRRKWPAVHSRAAPALVEAELRLEDPQGTADEAHSAVGVAAGAAPADQGSPVFDVVAGILAGPRPGPVDVRVIGPYCRTRGASSDLEEALSRGIWKNEDCKANRATSIKTRPATTMPIRAHRCAQGADCSDLTNTQPRNAAEASGRMPTSSASPAWLKIRRR